jgi:hypothetical protein
MVLLTHTRITPDQQEAYFFGSVFEYIHCNKYQNFNKFQPTDSELKIH